MGGGPVRKNKHGIKHTNMEIERIGPQTVLCLNFLVGGLGGSPLHKKKPGIKRTNTEIEAIALAE